MSIVGKVRIVNVGGYQPNPVGRPPKLYQCLTCNAILKAYAVRSHKCVGKEAFGETA